MIAAQVTECTPNSQLLMDPRCPAHIVLMMHSTRAAVLICILFVNLTLLLFTCPRHPYHRPHVQAILMMRNTCAAILIMNPVNDLDPTSV